MWWPSHTRDLDFELGLACVLAKPLADATPEQALDAVGGWFILNDWSARDVQADDARRNVFGPVIKANTFANSIGCDVLTADAVPDWTAMRGRVRVDGELWCEATTADPKHSLRAMLAYASAGERLDAGDVISTGTIPGCCGDRGRAEGRCHLRTGDHDGDRLTVGGRGRGDGRGCAAHRGTSWGN